MFSTRCCEFSVQDPSCLVDMLDECSRPDVILRVLTCLVNIHSVVINHRTTESQPEPQTSSTSSAHSEVPNATAVSSFDGEYLRKLREKLRCLCEHCDSGIQESTFRLLRLCQ